MTQTEIRELLDSNDTKTKYVTISKAGKETTGTFSLGHYNNETETKKLENKNLWLFDFRPGFGKGFQIMLEGDEVGVLRESF